MTIKEFIEAAIEGGWVDPHGWWTVEEKPEKIMGSTLSQIGLDPKAWEAVGKVKGWEEKITLEWDDSTLSYKGAPFLGGEIGYPYSEGACVTWECITWKYKMLCMIEELQKGRTLESYIATL